MVAVGVDVGVSTELPPQEVKSEFIAIADKEVALDFVPAQSFPEKILYGPNEQPKSSALADLTPTEPIKNKAKTKTNENAIYFFMIYSLYPPLSCFNKLVINILNIVKKRPLRGAFFI
jgi:hypothetical protein